MSESFALDSDESVWDTAELGEIIAHISIDYESIISHEEEKAKIKEGHCFEFNKLLMPFRWEDFETKTRSDHLAVSGHNVMYLKEKYPKHKLNPCPPACCCNRDMYREDFEPKTRKMIPLEKIQDIEVQEAGSNELLTPPRTCGIYIMMIFGLFYMISMLNQSSSEGAQGENRVGFLIFIPIACIMVLSNRPLSCVFPPIFNPIPIELPISKASISTAGSSGPELVIDGIADANAFRRMVMELKRGSGTQIPSAPQQQGMPIKPDTLGANSEIVSLLQDIALSRREMLRLLQDP